MNGGSSDLRHREIKPGGANGTVPKTPDDALPQKRKTGTKISSNIDQAQESCRTCCMPCLISQNPLPENPTKFQQLKHAFMLPLHGNVASYLQFAVVCLQLWIVLYSVTHGEAMPGGNLFSLLILFICCAIGGYLISLVHLPPLLGMLIVGVMLRNIPTVDIIGESINMKWSGALRKIALTVILTRAGLGLDLIKLRKLSWAVLRLAFLPCLSEIITVGIASHFILGFPWKWSLMLGCILGALSPAVTVPLLVNLQDRDYGVAKGIPTMLLAAGGLDNVFCVTGFSVFMGIIFSEGDLAVTIVKGPLGVFVGIVYGFVAGIFLWYIPSKDSANKLFYRSLLLIGFGMIAIFGSSVIQLSGAGPLGCLTTATVAGYKWRQRRMPGEPDEVSGVMALLWLIAQHFLFGLIGAAVDISKIESSTAGLGILTLAIGLVVRSAVDFTVTLRTGFNLKERVFITLTWLSKATVQAAIGGLALDKVRESDNPDAQNLKYATDILTLSVLAIVICAPTGATLMTILGPRFLQKGYNETEAIEETDNTKHSKHVEIIDMTKIDIDEPEMKEIVEEPIIETQAKRDSSAPTKEPIVETKMQGTENQNLVISETNLQTKAEASSQFFEVPVKMEEHNYENEVRNQQDLEQTENDPESPVFLEDNDSDGYEYPEIYKSQITITLSNSNKGSASSQESENDGTDRQTLTVSPRDKEVEEKGRRISDGIDNPAFSKVEETECYNETNDKSMS